MGSAALIPLEYYFDFAAKRRVKKKWRVFAEHFSKKFAATAGVSELAALIR